MTYSIVGHDAETGELGVAVQSRSFNTGAAVAWARAGGAGIVVVPAEGEPWERVLDLRVEDGDDSLAQLRSLVDRAEAYRRWNRAEHGRAELAEAAGLAQQQRLWSPILDALGAGDPEAARAHYRALLAVEPRWEAYARALDAHPELQSLAPLFAA